MNDFPQYTRRRDGGPIHQGEPVRLDSYLDSVEPTPRPARRKFARKAVLVPLAVVAGTALLVGLMWSAADVLWSMGDRAPVVAGPMAKPTAQPGPPVPKPVEKSPPVPISTSGDRVYILGKQLGRGEYGARCIAQATCTWWVYRVVDELPVPVRSGTAGYGDGAVVVLGADDYAFGTLGFDAWMPR